MAIGYNAAQASAGGTAPLVATWLIHATGTARAPALYLMAAASVSLVAASGMIEPAGEPLPGEREEGPADRQEVTRAE